MSSRLIKFERAKESERYAVFNNTETVEDKNAKGDPVQKNLCASKAVYIHKSVADDEPFYMLVPGRLFEAMQAQMPKGDDPTQPPPNNAGKKRR